MEIGPDEHLVFVCCVKNMHSQVGEKLYEDSGTYHINKVFRMLVA